MNSQLLARDMRAAAVELDKQTRQFESELSAQLQPQSPVRYSAPTRAATKAVRMMGVSEGTNGVVLLAELGDRSLADARETLCFQASRWIRRSADGRTFRVQRYRGNAPALHAGSIRC